MSIKYADIIIDISHEGVDRPFRYRIPQELEAKVQVGTAVKVPFGKQLRIILFYLIANSFTNNSLYIIILLSRISTKILIISYI